ncbi:MAG TPA: hypothetical protein PLM26_10900, partial [Saprospiraceae bacterium]|nr:hypothetical protein [Saprospiraceae bacterium]
AISESKDVKVQLRTYCDGQIMSPPNIYYTRTEDGRCCFRILFDDRFAELKYNVIGIDSINNMSLATLPYGFFTGEIKPNGSSEEICIHTNTTHFTVSIIKNGNTILCAEVTLDPNCHNL